MNFSLGLFCLVVFTGIFFLLDLVIFKPRRVALAKQALKEFEARSEPSIQAASGITAVNAARLAMEEKLLRQPFWLEYTASFFPVIIFVFALRSFVFEPFKIPSGSMIPTLLVGDLILVNKFIYGIRLPLIDKKIIDVSNPKRGDVMVFRYPKDPSLDYIKRIVGVAGDTVEYKSKKLIINGKPLQTKQLPDYFDSDKSIYFKHYEEKLGDVAHRVLNDEDKAPYVLSADSFPYRDNCQYNTDGFVCKVPAGHYFTMGDNRDNSSDSRYWGFVPDKNVVGKAFFIWMNFSQLKRIGSFN
jgi:signal peptidase I